MVDGEMQLPGALPLGLAVELVDEIVVVVVVVVDVMSNAAGFWMPVVVDDDPDDVSDDSASIAADAAPRANNITKLLQKTATRLFACGWSKHRAIAKIV